MRHEVDQMNIKPFRPRAFHRGLFDDDEHVFDVLLVSKVEAKFLRRNSDPVTDISDPDAQLQVEGLAALKPEEVKRELPVGFVQDTKGARNILAKGKFTEEKPIYTVRPDPIASLML